MARSKAAAIVLLAVSAIAAVGFVAWVAGNAAWESREAAVVIELEQAKPESPRLSVLAAEMDKGEPLALVRFWDEMKGHAPLIEPVAGDDGSSWVTFLWRGAGGTRRMSLMGGPAAAEPMKWLTRLGNSDLWYRTVRVSSDARFVYWFQVNGPVRWPMDPASEEKMLKGCPLRPDPLNARDTSGWPPGSVAELPKAPPEPWLQRPEGVAKGELTEHTIQSANQERTFKLYTPASFERERDACGLLILFDGGGFASSDIPAPVILDNLLAKKKIRPLVAVFVDQTAERNSELSCSESFADFVATELVPWVRRKTGVDPGPQRTIVGGMSAGGLMAAYCGFRRPEVFGNVLSLSGSFPWYPGLWEGKEALDGEPAWLTRQYLTAPRRDVRFYMAAGRFENTPVYNLLGENRHLRDVLLARGYSVDYHEFSGGHDPVGWRGPFADGLMALAPNR